MICSNTLALKLSKSSLSVSVMSCDKLFILGDGYNPIVDTSSHPKNVQSTSFRLLQRALESDEDNINNTIDLMLNCHAKAPKIKNFNT